jgi:hypothetical protein
MLSFPCKLAHVCHLKQSNFSLHSRFILTCCKPLASFMFSLQMMEILGNKFRIKKIWHHITFVWKLYLTDCTCNLSYISRQWVHLNAHSYFCSPLLVQGLSDTYPFQCSEVSKVILSCMLVLGCLHHLGCIDFSNKPFGSCICLVSLFLSYDKFAADSEFFIWYSVL